MSLSEEITLACPTCGAKQPFRVWGSVNASLSPELKEKILDRSLVTFHCAKCDASAEVAQELMYHDMDRHVMVFWGDEPPEEPEGLAGPLMEKMKAEYVFRHVRSFNELIEKILLWDAGLDDRVVEVFKVLLLDEIDASRRGEDPELFFQGVSRPTDADAEMEFVLVNEEAMTPFSVAYETLYRGLENDLLPRLPSAAAERGKWLRVDAEYVAEYLDAGESD